MSRQGSLTPLIHSDNDHEVQDAQRPKFSQPGITLLIACCGFVACTCQERYAQRCIEHSVSSLAFVFRAIIVTIPQVSIDLESAPSVIRYVKVLASPNVSISFLLLFFSLAVSLSVIAGCIGNLCGVGYSTTCALNIIFGCQRLPDFIRQMVDDPFFSHVWSCSALERCAVQWPTALPYSSQHLACRRLVQARFS